MITYVKTPELMGLNSTECELASFLHEELVKLAVDMYLNEYKLKLANTKNSE
jgi:hypothetical protein